jgi:hypothetical protein
MNTLEMVQAAKRLCKSPLLDESALTTETDSALPISSWSRWLNDSQSYHMNLVIAAAEEYFGTIATLSFVAGTQEYSIPGNTIQLRYLERTDSYSRAVIPININDRLRYEPFDGDTDPYLTPDYNYLWNNKLGFAPTPTVSASNNINVLYIRRLPDLSYGTASTATSTSITLATTPSIGLTSNEDDYYNGATIKIISGTTGAGESRVITDYVGSTRVATVAAWTVTPTGTIVYNIECDIPQQYHPAIPLYAAILAKASDEDSIAQIKPLHDEWVRQLVNGLIPRQSQMPRYVNVVDP